MRSPSQTFLSCAVAALAGLLALPACAQEALPWQQQGVRRAANDAYRPPVEGDTFRYTEPARERSNEVYRAPADTYRPVEPYRPADTSRSNDAYSPPQQSGGGYRVDDSYRSGGGSSGFGEPYAPPPRDLTYERDNRAAPAPYAERPSTRSETFSQNEIMDAGHGFFGSVSQGLANVIEHAFKKAGRPNGYILGEDAGGAIVAGLRYGEGVLHTKDAGTHKVYWQGPSVGYDFGAEGSKTMVLVYNLRDPSDIYHRFGGVQGSAYLVGGVSIQFQQYGDVKLAPIRSGVGLRLGANLGYLKYTRSPTWNPF